MPLKSAGATRRAASLVLFVGEFVIHLPNLEDSHREIVLFAMINQVKPDGVFLDGYYHGMNAFAERLARVQFFNPNIEFLGATTSMIGTDACFGCDFGAQQWTAAAWDWADYEAAARAIHPHGVPHQCNIGIVITGIA